MPSVRAYTENGVDPTATLTLTKPTGTATDDLGILWGGDDELDPGAGPHWAAKSGWTKQADGGADSSDVSCGLYTRVIDGTEGATEGITTHDSAVEGKSGYWVTIQDIDTAAPVNVVGTPSIDSGSTGTAPSITTTVAGCLILAFIACDGDDMGPVSVSGGTWAMHDADVDCGGTTEGVTCAFATYVQASAGATTAASWTTQLTDGKISVQIAIAPAASTLTRDQVDVPRGMARGEQRGSFFESARGLWLPRPVLIPVGLQL